MLYNEYLTKMTLSKSFPFSKLIQSQVLFVFLPLYPEYY